MRADWVSPWWQSACLPDRRGLFGRRLPGWSVAGFGLFTLSVWHRFALANVGNAYLIGRQPGPADAAGLVLMCGRNRLQGLDLMHRPDRLALLQRLACWRISLMRWETVDAACRDYVTACTRVASRWERSGSPCAVPETWHLLGMLGEVAWDMPYMHARCIYDARAEIDGDTSIMSPAAQEMEDNWADYEKLDGVQQLQVA